MKYIKLPIPKYDKKNAHCGGCTKANSARLINTAKSLYKVPRYVHEKGTSKRDWVMNTAAEGLSLLNNLVVLWFSNAGAQEKTTQNSNILAYEYKR